MTLAPVHLEDLRKSGLTDETISRHHIETIRPCDITRLIGFDTPGLVSAYRIPFPPFKYGFERYKLFYEVGYERNADGKKKPKYVQKKNTANRLYIPLDVWPVLGEVSKELWMTEGEKKALKATQEGIPTIGITGLWNWKAKGSDDLIPCFAHIALKGRTIRIVPDSDWLDLDKLGNPKNLKQAVYRFCYALQERGARTVIVKLPRRYEDV